MFRRANEFDFNSNITGDNNVVENEMNVDIDMINSNNNQMPNQNMQMNSTISNPITEAMQEKVVHRTIMHEVPQDCQFMQD